ncbi:tRNA(Ile)-lysidine synthase [Exiguobacterium sp. S17]|nr:tRNA(Ile)-lysidine synthase [Exiguobacterium sp. S17]
MLYQGGATMMKVLVAVSGGVDSIVLLDRVARSGADVGVAHVHHGLRPESDEEFEFVRQLAKAYGVPFHGTRLAFPDGGSQAVYRAARYAFFETVMREDGYTELMTAHHADDELETVLIQLHRNVVEVTGIPERRPFAEGMLVRPLLTETKRQLLAYASANGLVWREDATNEQAHYLRNKIRHHIVPRLLDVWPNVVQDVGSAARRQRELWLKRYDDVGKWMVRHVRCDMKTFHVKLEDVASLNGLERYVLGRLLSARYGVELGEAISRLLDSPKGTGRYDLEGGARLQKYDGVISLVTHTDSVPTETPGDRVISSLPVQTSFGDRELSLEVVTGKDGIPLEVLTFPLTVRSVRRGDMMKLSIGTKKVARILIDAKVRRENRPFVPLVVDATGRIVAIVGVRVSDFPDKSDAICPRLMVK